MTRDRPNAHGAGEIDPVTGYETTGHVWNGIRELNTPFPRIVIWALALTFTYAVIAWVLLPAWPLGRTHTKGVLGLDQGAAAVAGYHELAARRQDWLTRFATPDFAALQADTGLMRLAMPAAARLFADNCAACHGPRATGGPGFPDLADSTWLWGGDPKTVAETVRLGINGTDPDTRFAQMPSFDWVDHSERRKLAAYVAALPGGHSDPDSPEAAFFSENCAACHGEGGTGGLGSGAPSLTDRSVIYGQDISTVERTLKTGRQGVMPSWNRRLSEEQINLLALYVSRLSATASQGRE
ncbi:cytochrome-c oxidase, cbb3-type subunit III [Acidimangrovimonas pyrenivorans]|uniref:Cbb3-type cytochrome c oxidase subunit n=1 Tax=Acidimangrovimonas pyrenivorans TaxID=2030798 RepID=A0ABV7AFQ5_9RHOB